LVPAPANSFIVARKFRPRGEETPLRGNQVSIVNHNPSRRHVLQVIGSSAGLVAVGGLASCEQTGSPPTGPVNGGNISALKVGALLVMSNIAVGLDTQGVYAMSAVCTHAGCLLDDGAHTIGAGLDCPCHGSTFDGDGAVTKGPAPDPLQHYLVTIAADGSITVHGSQPVSASARTALP
jgi:Rieske Fe-S protein